MIVAAEEDGRATSRHRTVMPRTRMGSNGPKESTLMARITRRAQGIRLLGSGLQLRES
jgi:hypothetical protein